MPRTTTKKTTVDEETYKKKFEALKKAREAKRLQREAKREKEAAMAEMHETLEQVENERVKVTEKLKQKEEEEKKVEEEKVEEEKPPVKKTRKPRKKKVKNLANSNLKTAVNIILDSIPSDSPMKMLKLKGNGVLNYIRTPSCTLKSKKHLQAAMELHKTQQSATMTDAKKSRPYSN